MIKEGVKNWEGVWRIQNELIGYAQKWYKSNSHIWNSLKHLKFKLKIAEPVFLWKYFSVPTKK